MTRETDILYKAALSWMELTKYNYTFVYGKSQRKHELDINFYEESFAHVMGIQYLRDVGLPRYNSKNLLNKILSGKITCHTLSRGRKYEDTVLPRLKAIINLKDAFEGECKLFSFRPEDYPFHTEIKANYFISANVGDVCFYFVVKENNIWEEENSKYTCMSAFEKSSRNYEMNQRPLKILRKYRTDLETGRCCDLLIEG